MSGRGLSAHAGPGSGRPVAGDPALRYLPIPRGQYPPTLERLIYMLHNRRTLTRIEEFMDLLKGMDGVLDVARLSRDTVQEIVQIEDSITEVSCGLRMENSGVGTCASREHVFAISCDGRFPRPREITMELIDEDGVVIGHDVPLCMMDHFKARDDVIWIADSFIMYPGKVTANDARMVLHASRCDDAAIPEGLEPWIFYPSTSSAMRLNGILGFEGEGLSTIILGVDRLCEGPSVPVTDVVQVPCGGSGHGEPSPQDAFYRCDLVGEMLEVAELPFADEDLHALVVVEMHMHRSVDERLMLVLQVGELVADGGHRVVVHHDYGPDHPLVLVLPLVLGQGIPDEVPYGLGPADVALLRYGLVECLQKLGLQRDPDARHAFHAHGIWRTV